MKIEAPSTEENKYHGTLWQINLTSNERISIRLWTDDGTYGKFMTISFKGIPVGTFPLINQEGFRRFIDALSRMFIYEYGDEGKEWMAETFIGILEEEK